MGDAPKAHGGKARFMCQCDCGAAKVVRGRQLKDGTTSSCGCLAAELTRTRSSTHGMTHSKEWAAWHRIKLRCYNKSHDSYVHYGARGITVCDRWRTSFEAFLADMGPMPPDKPTIDRLDNSKGYEPGNCRWASVTEQNRNKGNNVFLTYGERTMTTAEWAREIGMSHSGFADRLKYMTLEEAMTLPDQRGQRRWRNCA